MQTRTAVLIAAPVAAIAVVLGGSELVLSGVAERRITSELRRNGKVERVDVDAWPAVKLLWGQADHLDVRMGEARTGTGRIAELLERSDEIGDVDARVGVLRVGPLTLRDARFSKDGDAVRGEALLTDDDLRAALPPQLEVRPVAAADGELVLEARAAAFGFQATVQARLSARTGDLVIAPETQLPLVGELATLTVFSDDRLLVTGVGASRRGDGYAVSANGRLRRPRDAG